MPAASKASRSATRVLDIAARERRIRKRIEKLEEDCGQEENFQDVAAAAPFDDDGGNGILGCCNTCVLSGSGVPLYMNSLY
eukprot:m.73032 g.73032  ORF g.73032 m.73032 type:complete len:81 (+) comp16115_c0_seq23:112-354(+)